MLNNKKLKNFLVLLLSAFCVFNQITPLQATNDNTNTPTEDNGEVEDEVKQQLEALIAQLPTLDEYTSILENNNEEKYEEVATLLEQIETIAEENSIDLTYYDAYMAIVSYSGVNPINEPEDDTVSTAEALKTKLESNDTYTVKLSGDISFSTPITIAGTKTLDLNGKTITYSSTSTSNAFNVNGTVTVVDNDTNNKGSIKLENNSTNSNQNLFKVNTNATLNIESGTYTTKNASVIFSEGTTNIKGGTLTSQSSTVTVWGGIGTLNITGGTIENTATNNDKVLQSAATAVAVGNSSYTNVTATIQGGTITSKSSNAIFLGGGSLTIKDTETTSPVIQCNYGSGTTVYVDNTPTLNIEGGKFNISAYTTFTPIQVAKSTKPTITITGGKYNNNLKTNSYDNTGYLKNGYEVKENTDSDQETYGYVVASMDEASVTTNDTTITYPTFEEAITNATDNSTIKVLRDVDFNTVQTLNKDKVTLDLNGHNAVYSGTANTTGLTVSANYELTITDTSEAKTGVLKATLGNMISVSSGATLNINNGTIQVDSGLKTVIDVSGTLNVKDGAIYTPDKQSTTSSVTAFDTAIKANANSIINISGGKIGLTDAAMKTTTYVASYGVQANNATVTVTGGTFQLKSGFSIYGYNGSTISVTNATSTTGLGGALYIAGANTTATLGTSGQTDGPTFKNTTAGASYLMHVEKNASLTVNSGTYSTEGTKNGTYNIYLLYIDGGTTVNLNGGTFTHNGKNGAITVNPNETALSTVKITDGEYINNSTIAAYAVSAGKANFTIEGGKFNSIANNYCDVNATMITANTYKLKISGGRFSTYPTKSSAAAANQLDSYLVDGKSVKTLTNESSYKYQVTGQVAKVTYGNKDYYYASVQDAINSATSTGSSSKQGVITLIDNESTDATLNKIYVTIDTDNKNISGTLTLGTNSTYSKVIGSGEITKLVANSTNTIEGVTVDELNIGNAKARVTINSGYIKELSFDADVPKTTLTITGGKFGFDPSDYIDTTLYQAINNNDGTWSVEVAETANVTTFDQFKRAMESTTCKNVVVTKAIVFNDNVTSVGDKTLTINDNYTVTTSANVSVHYDFNIGDGENASNVTIVGKGTITSNYQDTITVNEKSTLTVGSDEDKDTNNNVTLKMGAGTGYNTINVKGGTLNVKGGTVTHNAATNQGANGAIYVTKGYVNISDGIVNTTTNTANAIVVKNDVTTENTKVSISGGKIRSSGYAGANPDIWYTGNDVSNIFDITGGTFGDTFSVPTTTKYSDNNVSFLNSDYTFKDLGNSHNSDYRYEVLPKVGEAVLIKSGQAEGTQYESVKAAINAASDGDTVKVLRDSFYDTLRETGSSGECTIESGKNITLDLNGFTTTINKNPITVKGTLTIVDNSEKKTGSFTTNSLNPDKNFAEAVYSNQYATKGFVVDGGTLNIESGTLTSNSRGGFNQDIYPLVEVKNAGTLNLNGGRLETNTNSLYDRALIASGEGTTVNITNDAYVYNYSMGVKISDKATLNMDSGKIAFGGYSLELENATANLSGNARVGGQGDYTKRATVAITAYGSTIDISGGVIVADGQSTGTYGMQLTGNNNVTISGGSVSSNGMAAIYCSAKTNKVLITGGTISNSNTANSITTGSSEFKITGGLFWSGNYSGANILGNNAIVYGGTFTQSTGLTGTNGVLAKGYTYHTEFYGTNRDRTVYVVGPYSGNEKFISIDANGNEHKFTTLEEAISLSTKGSTIKLNGDYTSTLTSDLPTINVDKDLVIDLNGHTLNIDKGETDSTSAITLSEGVNLTVTDSSTDKNGKLTSNTNVITTDDKSTVTLNAGSIEPTNGHGIVVKGEGTKVTVNDGAIKVTGEKDNAIYFDDTAKDSNVTIKNGTFTSSKSSVISGGNSDNKDTNIVVINNGTFAAVNDESSSNGNNIFDDSNYKLTINNGKFNCGKDNQTNGVVNKDSKASILGGEYSTKTNITLTSTETYTWGDNTNEADKDTYPYIINSASAAVVTHSDGTETSYTTLADAISSVQDGETITLKKDVTTEATTTIDKNITLDLGGYTLSSTGNDSTVTIDSEKNVTIKNGTITDSTGSGDEAVNASITVKDKAHLTLGNGVNGLDKPTTTVGKIINEGTLDVTKGASTGKITEKQSSNTNVDGGTVDSISGETGSNTNISSGKTGEIDTKGNVTVTGGETGKIKTDGSGDTNISGGKVESLENKSSDDANISGGTVGDVETNTGSTTDISGGNITGIVTGEGTNNITGGTFTNKPSGIKDGYVAAESKDDDGKTVYKVIPKSDVAVTITDKDKNVRYFESLDDASDCANENDTLVIEKDTNANSVPVNKSLTIDLNGKTLTSTNTSAIVAGGDNQINVTIKGEGKVVNETDVSEAIPTIDFTKATTGSTLTIDNATINGASGADNDSGNGYDGTYAIDAGSNNVTLQNNAKVIGGDGGNAMGEEGEGGKGSEAIQTTGNITKDATSTTQKGKDGYSAANTNIVVKNADNSEAYFKTLSEAFEYAQDGATIILNKSFETDEACTLTTKNVTLNLNGNTLTKTSNPITVSGSLTVTGNENGEGSISGNNTSKVFDVTNDGSLTINSGSISNSGNAINNSGDLVVNGGTISTSGNSEGAIKNAGTATINNGSITSSSKASAIQTTDGTTNINGGSITNTTEETIGDTEFTVGNAISVDGNGTVNITGGDITSTNGSTIYTSGTLNVKDDLNENTSPTITSTNKNPAVYNNGGDTTISGGKFKYPTTGEAVTTQTGNTKLVGGKYATQITPSDGYTTVSNTDTSDNADYPYTISLDETNASVSVTYPNNTTKYYASLEDALNSADDNATIKLLKDTTISSDVVVDADNVTLDLNNHKASKSASGSGSALTINNNFTIKDDSAEKNGSFDVNGEKAITVGKSGTLNVESGTITSTNSAIENNGGTVNVNGGTVTSTGTSPTIDMNDGSLNVKDGTIENKSTKTADNEDTAVAIDYTAGSMTIEGGNITSNVGNAIYTNPTSDESVVTIKDSTDAEGKTVSPTITSNTKSGLYNHSLTDGKVEIYGGKFKGGNEANPVDSKKPGLGQTSDVLSIFGGKFASSATDSSLKAYLKDGYSKVANTDSDADTYPTVVQPTDIDKAIVVTYGEGENARNEYYSSLEDALEYVSDGATIKVNEDVKISKPITVDKDIVIDLNGNDLSYTGNQDAFIDIVDTGKLTITDTSKSDDKGTINPGTATAIKLEDNAAFTLDDGNITSEEKDVIVISGENANVSITGGSVEATGSNNKAVKFDDDTNNSSLTVEAGTLSSKNSNVVAGGSSDSNAPSKVTIKGGTFTSDGSKASIFDNTKTQYDIQGGSFDSGTSTTGNKGVLTTSGNNTSITGGEYSYNKTSDGNDLPLPEGYSLNNDASDTKYPYEVVNTNVKQASVKKSDGTTTEYTTLQEAINAASDTDTVTLLTDLTLNKPAEIKEKSITLDLNGKTLNSNSDDSTITITGTDKNVTVTNGTVNDSKGGKSSITVDSGVTLTIGEDNTEKPTTVGKIITKGNTTITDGTTASEVETDGSGTASITGGLVTTLDTNGTGTSSVTGGVVGNVETGEGTTVNISNGTKSAGEGTVTTVPTITGSITGDGIKNVTGGSFYENPSKLVGENYVVEKDTSGEQPIYDVITKESAVVSIDEDGNKYYYPSIQDAIEKAPDGSTIKLIKDIETDQPITIDNKVTIDLNGHTLKDTTTDESTSFITVNGDNGDLTVTDSSTGTSGKIDGGKATTITTNGKAKVTLDDGTITNGDDSTSDVIVIDGDNSDVKVNGATVAATGSSNKAVSFTDSATNATFTVDNENSKLSSVGSNVVGGGVPTTNNKIIIKNGEFSNGDSHPASLIDNTNTYVTIEGGKFNSGEAGKGALSNGDGNADVTGGLFSESTNLTENTVEIGYNALTNEGDNIYKYKVALDPNIAVIVTTPNEDGSVTTKTYSSISAALSADDTKDGSTIKLNHDISLSAPLVVDKDITLDLNGKTIGSTSTGSTISISPSKIVTIKNGTITDATGTGEGSDKNASITIGKGANVTLGDGTGNDSHPGLTVGKIITEGDVTVTEGTKTDAISGTDKDSDINVTGGETGKIITDGKVNVTGGKTGDITGTNDSNVNVGSDTDKGTTGTTGDINTSGKVNVTDGKTGDITTSGSGSANITGGETGKLTINGTGTNSIDGEKTKIKGLTVNTGTKVELKDGEVVGDVTQEKNSTLDVTGGDITGKVTTDGTLNVKTGNIEGEITGGKNSNITVGKDGATETVATTDDITTKGSVTVTDGGKTGIITTEDTGHATITDGNVDKLKTTGSGTSEIIGGSVGDVDAGKGTTVKITGGKITGDITGDGKIEITGGTFDKADPSKYIDPDKYIVEKSIDDNGKSIYKVVDKASHIDEYAATVTDEAGNTHYYKTLDDALKDSKSGETVTLQKDVETNTPITIDKDITLDLNSKTITNDSSSDPAIKVISDKKASIKNGTIKNSDSNDNGVSIEVTEGSKVELGNGNNGEETPTLKVTKVVTSGEVDITNGAEVDELVQHNKSDVKVTGGKTGDITADKGSKTSVESGETDDITTDGELDITGGKTGNITGGKDSNTHVGGNGKTGDITSEGKVVIDGNATVDKITTDEAGSADINGGKVKELDTNGSGTSNITSGEVGDITIGTGTTLNIKGGNVGDINQEKDSILNISGGNTGNITTQGKVNVTDGNTGTINTKDNGSANISGGNVKGLVTEGTGNSTISGGKVGSIHAGKGTTVTINSGTITGSIDGDGTIVDNRNSKNANTSDTTNIATPIIIFSFALLTSLLLIFYRRKQSSN